MRSDRIVCLQQRQEGRAVTGLAGQRRRLGEPLGGPQPEALHVRRLAVGVGAGGPHQRLRAQPVGDLFSLVQQVGDPVLQRGDRAGRLLELGARAMAEARASSNRPWSSSWSRAAAMSGQARRTTSPPARARLRKYVACRSRVASSRADLGEPSPGEAAHRFRDHEPWLAVTTPVQLHQVRIEELQQVVSGVAGGGSLVQHRRGGVEQERPHEHRHLEQRALADFGSRSKVHARAESRPCLPARARATTANGTVAARAAVSVIAPGRPPASGRCVRRRRGRAGRPGPAPPALGRTGGEEERAGWSDGASASGSGSGDSLMRRSPRTCVGRTAVVRTAAAG